MSPPNPASASNPKPAASVYPDTHPYRKGAGHKAYTGPDPASLPKARTKAEADAYFDRAGKGNLWSPKVDRRLRYGSAVSCVAAVIFVTLFVDYGEKEHVFTPLRNQVDKVRKSFWTLSPAERKVVGSEQPPAAPMPGRVGELESEWKPS